MQPDESLLIACKSYQDGCANRHGNISIKKIPNMLLGRCEFGKDDYSLNIVNMPVDETQVVEDDTEETLEPEIQEAPKKTSRKKTDDSQAGLF
jgi:adenine-specific DNA-methyltransferase